MAIAKFQQNFGFSLTQNTSEQLMDFNASFREVLRVGAIPEFVQVSDCLDVYRYFTEACIKNISLQRQTNWDSTDELLQNQNIKDDVALIQFKLVNRNTSEVTNTISFINVPESKQSDANLVNLLEIIQKQSMSGNHKTYLPFNKSILTRVIYEQLKSNNITVISHINKRMIESASQNPQKNFLGFLANWRSGNVIKTKISPQDAVKTLEQYFPKEIKSVYAEIGRFRDGRNSFLKCQNSNIFS